MNDKKPNTPEQDIAAHQLNHAMTAWLKKKEEKASVVAEFDKQIKELYTDMLEAHDRLNSPQVSFEFKK